MKKEGINLFFATIWLQISDDETGERHDTHGVKREKTHNILANGPIINLTLRYTKINTRTVKDKKWTNEFNDPKHVSSVQNESPSCIVMQ